MILRIDSGTRISFDNAGRVTAVYSGRDYSGDIAYVAGKFARSNPVNVGHDTPRASIALADER